MDDLTRIPIEYLNRIADHCPRAMSTYLLCWREADEHLDITLSKRYVSWELNLSFTRLLNDLKALAKEGLLEFLMLTKSGHTEPGEGIHITLANYGNE